MLPVKSGPVSVSYPFSANVTLKTGCQFSLYWELLRDFFCLNKFCMKSRSSETMVPPYVKTTEDFCGLAEVVINLGGKVGWEGRAGISGLEFVHCHNPETTAVKRQPRRAFLCYMMIANPIRWQGYSTMHSLNQGQGLDRTWLRLHYFPIECF